MAEQAGLCMICLLFCLCPIALSDRVPLQALTVRILRLILRFTPKHPAAMQHTAAALNARHSIDFLTKMQQLKVGRQGRVARRDWEQTCLRCLPGC